MIPTALCTMKRHQQFTVNLFSGRSSHVQLYYSLSNTEEPDCPVLSREIFMAASRNVVFGARWLNIQAAGICVRAMFQRHQRFAVGLHNPLSHRAPYPHIRRVCVHLVIDFARVNRHVRKLEIDGEGSRDWSREMSTNYHVSCPRLLNRSRFASLLSSSHDMHLWR